jgi:hypothetical protein
MKIPNQRAVQPNPERAKAELLSRRQAALQRSRLDDKRRGCRRCPGRDIHR